MKMKKVKTKVIKEPLARRRKRTILNVKKNWLLYLFVLPVVLYYIIFKYFPIYGIQIAFQDYKIGELFGESKWVGLKWFIKFFNSYWFPIVMKNTILISLLQFAICFPVPIILALLLNEVKNKKSKNAVQTVAIAPHFISMVILCGAIQLFLSESNGIIGIAVDTVRSWFGLKPINLLLNGSMFKWIYVLSGVWQEMGWSSILYFAALSSVDEGMLEAAKIDGANKLQRIRYINFPVLLPTIVIQLILTMGGILSVGFEKVYLLQSDSILSYSEVISTYVYRSGLAGGQYSFGSAVGLFNSVINFILLIIVNNIIRKINKDMSLL